MDNNRAKQLGEASIPKLLYKFSMPAIIGMLVNAIYNVIDRIFVGQAVGDKALAALSFSFPFMTAIMAVAMLVGLGGTSLVAISLGEGNRDKAAKILNNVCVCAFFLEVIVSIICYIFMKPLLKLFGTPDGEVMNYAVNYMRIILAGSVFQGVGFALNAIIRSEGNPKIAMITMLSGAVVNIVFDWLLTMVVRLGVAGAAIATVLGYLVSMLWVLYYFIGKRSSLKLNLKGYKPDFTLISKIMFLGISPALVQLVMASVNILYNNLLMKYGALALGVGKGDVAVSAFAVYNSAMSIAIMPIFGINQGVQPIVGYNYGAKNFDRVRKTMKYGILAASSIVIFASIIIRLFPEQIVRAFNSSPDLIMVGRKALQINTLCFPILGIQIICSNYFQYINKPKAAMILSLSRQCLFLIPSIIILSYFFKLDGIFYAQPVSDILSTALSSIWVFTSMYKLGKTSEQDIK